LRATPLGVVDEERPELRVSRMRQALQGELLAGDEAVAEPAVQS